MVTWSNTQKSGVQCSLLGIISLLNVNVNADVYSLKSPWVQQTLQFALLVLEFSFMVSSPLGEYSTFSAANVIHNFPIFRSTWYPSLLGGQSQYGMRSLPDTSTNGQLWESSPRPSDLESNDLSTWWHASTIFVHPCNESQRRNKFIMIKL